MQICPNIKFWVSVPEKFVEAMFKPYIGYNVKLRFEFKPSKSVKPIDGGIITYTKHMYHYKITMYFNNTESSRYIRKGIVWIDENELDHIIKYYDKCINDSSIVDVQEFVNMFTCMLYGFNIFDTIDDDTKEGV